jgi:hypothetical protein
MGEEQEPKFSLVEIILLLMIAVPVDILEPIVDFASPVPVLGQILLIVMWFIDLITFAIIQFWLIMKGERGLWALSANLLEMIPYVNALPLRTFGVILTIYLANHPKIAQVARAPTSPASK